MCLDAIRKQPDVNCLQRMIITIDGPAGVGKSTIAQLLAKALNFDFLNTGAMYRCAALAALQAGIPIEDHDRLVEHVKDLKFEQKGERIFLDGLDVTERIRAADITKLVSSVANVIPLRLILIQWQRDFARDRNIVTEGRDQGTVVFTDAQCKIFLTASPEIRARRRTDQLLAQGVTADFQQILEEQVQRDLQDSQRSFGALKQSPDSEIVISDHMSPDDVLEALLTLVRAKTSPPH